MASTAPLVVVVVMAAVLAAPACAAVLPGGAGGHKFMEPEVEYLHDLNNSQLVSLLRQNLPQIRDIRIIDGPNGPRLDMPLSGCRDSLDCHHRFTNYLGLLVRMMETGKRRK